MSKLLGKLVSRFFIISLIIVFQMVWIFELLYISSMTNQIFNIILRLSALCVALYIANRQMKVYIKLSWIFLILFLPIVGIPCFFFFGRPELTVKTQKKMRTIVERHRKYIVRNEIIELDLKSENEDVFRQTIHNSNNYCYPVYREDTVKYYDFAEKAYESMLVDLKNAKKFIFMEYFIIGEGKMFDEILSILSEKVKQGVKVRIIYDDFGSINVTPVGFDKKLRKYGIEACCFNPYKPVLSVIMNDRDHRKIMVIDGEIAYTGGFNIADEYINEIERFGYWKDAGVRVTGDCVNSFTLMFLEMWSYINRLTEVETEFIFPKNENIAINDTENKKGFVQPFCDSPLESDNTCENAYIGMIYRARKYVYFFTPYLILSSELSNALIVAAKSGVDVRIVVPYIPDKKLIYIQTKANFKQLVKAGVKIYKYKPGFIHSKCCVSDDIAAIVGTCNLDFRSFYWNFEDMVYMYKCEAVLDVKKDALSTFDESVMVTKEECDNQNVVVDVIQSILQLFAPLL